MESTETHYMYISSSPDNTMYDSHYIYNIMISCVLFRQRTSTEDASKVAAYGEEESDTLTVQYQIF